jgi:hypothetical protein
MNENAGPDMCFLVKVAKQGEKDSVTEMGLVAIRSMSGQNTKFEDALRSVQLGYLWTDTSHQILIDELFKNEGDTEDGVKIKLNEKQNKMFQRHHYQREKLYKCVEGHPSVLSHWFRVVYSSQPWSENVVAAANEYNATHPFTPVILI